MSGMSADQGLEPTALPPDDASHPRLAGLADVLGGFRFAALVIALLAGFSLLIGLVLIVPEDAGVFGAFARDFKVWCLSYDPATGEMPIMLAAMMVSELALFASVVVFFWWGPLRRAWRRQRRALFRWSGSGLLLALALSVLLVVLADPRADAAEPTLGALRTAHTAPALRLVDQDERPVDLAELDDKVVLVTAIYATCGYTCPMIMAQARRAVASLTAAERADLVVLALTLDPHHDTPEVLRQLAAAQSLSSPTWRFLTGPPAEVEATLDRWDFARRKNPETGQIDHANLFVLLDRHGRIAFRLTLSTEREAWLADALRLLIAESRLAASGPAASP